MELTVPVGGGEIWAEDAGVDGTPLVLLHPGWGDADIWSPLISVLPTRFRVIRYDDRGFGRSPAPVVPFSRVDDLRAVLDHAGLTDAVIVGHSGGGGIALGLALSDPDRVAALILIAPGLPDYPWPADDPYWREFARLHAAGDRDALVSLGLRTWARAGADAAARGQVSSAVSTFLTADDLGVDPTPAYDRLGEVRTPAVVVRGDREYPMVADCSDRIAARIPGCRQVVIPGADHLLPLRVPGRLAAIIAGHAG
ncbi:MAG TPA: alpha/beta hydrolase [Streptosporangiaceae bacterium]|jgi:pimeloyl-ACP methyl ester carboxylesterase